MSRVARRFKSSRREAGLRGLVWTLTLERYAAIVGAGECHYCGGELADEGSGLDRRDPEAGYTTSNVVSACSHCNKAKLLHPYETWKRIADTFVAAHGKGAMWPAVEQAEEARRSRAQRAVDARTAVGVARGVTALALWAARCCAPKSDRSMGWYAVSPREEAARRRNERLEQLAARGPLPEKSLLEAAAERLTSRPSKAEPGFVWRGKLRPEPIKPAPQRRPKVERVKSLAEWRRSGLVAILIPQD